MSSHNTILPRQLQTSLLQASSLLYESACPNLGRSVISKVHEFTAAKKDATRQHCIHCHSPLHPGVCRVKLYPRPRITREIERLKKRLDNPRDGSLSSTQKKKVKRWMNSKNILVICCSFCKKTNRIPCAKRSERPQSLESQASQNISFQDFASRKRKRRSESTDPLSKLATSSTGGNFVSPPSKKQKRQSSSSSISLTSSTPGRLVHSIDVPHPSPSGRSSRSAKKDKYRQLQTMLKSAKQEQHTKNQSPLSKFLTSL
eukprot:XP_003723711.1 PREDICTED: UPF0711 protein C18orf21 homolog [Strongylocentrotus purpuratus]